ncbi:MAG: alpha/beta hydrolase [Bacilli bacterium]|nr:alpha/beta hydrolase [Bacilli bacterium]
MEKIFEVKLESGEVLKGLEFSTDKAVANLTIITGMDEYARRYKKFAEILNKNNINVFVLDAFGQGLNVSKVEELEIWPKDAFRKNVDAIALMIKKAKANGLKTVHFGHSMGSFMTQSLIERYPNIADKVILCGSNGGQLTLMKFGYLVAKTVRTKSNNDKPNKFLTNLSLGPYSKAIKNRETDLDWLSFNKENVKTYIADPYCGHPNTTGFWVEFLKGMKEIWQTKNLRKIPTNLPILIVSGKEDPVGRNGKGPLWLEKKYKSLGVEKVDLHLYEKMRHEILNEENNEEVINNLLEFILN